MTVALASVALLTISSVPVAALVMRALPALELLQKFRL